MKKLFVLMFVMISALTQAATIKINWAAPTEGSPAVRYEVQLKENTGEFFTIGFTTAPQTEILYTEVQPLVTYVGRVRAFDIQDRDGPWSTESNQYVLDPGIPGAPTIITITGVE